MLMRNAATESGADELLRALSRPSDTSASLRDVEERLTVFETQYGIDSEEMRRRVVTGELREDDEICTWLMLLNRRERLVRQG